MLTPERWRTVERIFHEATAQPAERRVAFVKSSSRGDEEIKSEVLSLLDAEERGGGVDDSVAAQVAADWAGISANEILGRDVDGYRVLHLLGAGGMGETYLAEDSALGRRAALKLLPVAFSNDSRRVRRFVEEARAASALNHPGIVTVYIAGVFEGRHYIASEFIDGETLRHRLAKGPLPAVEALDIAIQTGGALSAAHGAGIIHRDIKPENIMIRPDGFVKIIDFGLARAAGSSERAERLTNMGDVLGTLDYMAPEQAAGRPVDARADVYSLTVVLYEMLTGELPRELGSGSAKQSGKGARPPSGELLRVIRRGVTSDPDKRYQSVAELRSDLKDLRSRPARPPRHIPWIAAAAILISGAAFGVYQWAPFGPRPGAIHSLVVMPLKAIGAPDQHLEEGMSEAIITRLSGLHQLRVPPAAAIKPNEDAFQAARRLGVDAVLTGSVQRSGDRLRVIADLSRTSDQSQIWAQQYDENFTGIFGIQDAIAQRVVASLGAEIPAADRSALTRHESHDSRAYDLYLLGRDQWAQRTPESIRTAINMYQQAISIEPQFAQAYAGLADAYNLAVSGIPPLTRAPLARAAAEKALQLDPQSAEGHTALAFLEYKFEWRWQDSEREFRRAIEIDPHYALAHHWFGEFLKLRGRHGESISEFQRAIEDDPFSVPVRYDFILALLDAGKVAEARKALNETKAIEAASARVLSAESAVLAAEGHAAEATDWWLRTLLLSGVSEADVNAMRAAYRAGGRHALDQKRLDLLLEKKHSGSYLAPFTASTFADLYAHLQMRDETLRWLKKSADLREDAPLLMLAHTYDFLRHDPEFIALEKRVGF